MTSAKEIIQASGIGASEIAAVLGISPWADRWTIYARKHKLIEPEEQSEEMFWGTMLEPVIAQVFSRRMELPIEWYNQRVYNPVRPWQYASPDAFILDSQGLDRTGVLECKTAGLHQSGEWDRDASDEDGVPDYYVAQVQWQLSTLALETAYIAVLIAGNDFRVYRIEHDPVLEEILLEEGEEFWRKHILTQVEPPIGGSERARKYLRQRFPREREKLRPATVTEMEWLNQYAELRSLLDQGEAKKKELENQITQAIGDGEGLIWPRGKFTWKRTKDRSLVQWHELAEKQMEEYSEQEKKEFIARYTRTEPGYRRIHFREEVNQ